MANEANAQEQREKFINAFNETMLRSRSMITTGDITTKDVEVDSFTSLAHNLEFSGRSHILARPLHDIRPLALIDKGGRSNLVT